MLSRPIHRLRLRFTTGARTPQLFLVVAIVIFIYYFYMLHFQSSNREVRRGNHWGVAMIDKPDLVAMAAVREMTRFAWQGYVNACLSRQSPGNELAPVSKDCASNSDSLVGSAGLLTVIDSLDTLALLELTAEFQQARSFVQRLFDPRNSSQQDVSVFETTIRLLGGLLGAYSLSEDALFLRMAALLGDGLSGAFPANGKFATRVKLFTNISSGDLNPAELGSLYLEFAYLAELTGDRKYFDWVDRNQRALVNIEGLDGVLPKQLVSNEPMKLEAGSAPYSAGTTTDSYYEYLVKRCLFDAEPMRNCVSTFTRALDGIGKHLTIQVAKNDSGGTYTCITELSTPSATKRCSMEHLTCFAGGMFALAYLQQPNRVDWLRLAENVTETCYLSYQHSPTKLGPERFVYNPVTRKLDAEIDSYLLRPETIESIFYLYRVTKNPKYRAWGWEILKALNTSTRVGSGFSGIEGMSSGSAKPRYDNLQWSFFLAETLKYLYLLFTPVDKLPLQYWLLNTEAHVIPTRLNLLRNKLVKPAKFKLWSA